MCLLTRQDVNGGFFNDSSVFSVGSGIRPGALTAVDFGFVNYSLIIGQSKMMINKPNRPVLRDFSPGKGFPKVT
jgi:hypothetical protein